MSPTVPSNWVETFFDEGYGETFRRLGKYDSTVKDIESLLELVPIPRGSRILDVPCGWGRHAGVLAQRGFAVVGVDVSGAQIRQARREWPDVEFHQSDMRTVPGGGYSAVLNLWTSFGSLPSPGDDVEALRAWWAAAGPGGYLVMELTTREYAEASNDRNGKNTGQKTVTINGVREDAFFDWENGISYNTYTRDDWSRTCVTRLYTRPELSSMLSVSGYDEVRMYGGFSGGPVRDDARTVVVARKPT